MKFTDEQLGWVDSAASRCHTRFVERDELIQVGRIALWRCLQRYDAASGASVKTYASKRIEGAMRDLIRVTVGWRRYGTTYNVDFQEELPEEVVDAMEIDEQTPELMLALAQEQARLEEFRDVVIAALPVQMQQVVSLRIARADYSCDEIGKVLGISRWRVYQVQAQAYEMIRNLAVMAFLDDE